MVIVPGMTAKARKLSCGVHKSGARNLSGFLNPTAGNVAAMILDVVRKPMIACIYIWRRLNHRAVSIYFFGSACAARKVSFRDLSINQFYI